MIGWWDDPKICRKVGLTQIYLTRVVGPEDEPHNGPQRCAPGRTLHTSREEGKSSQEEPKSLGMGRYIGGT